METKKIIITGANGQLGKDAVLYFSKKYDVLAFTKKELDITNKKGIEHIFQMYKPDILLNCAAYTDVNACEDKYESAINVNSYGPFLLARVCDKYKCKLVHISTDYIFDGNKQLEKGYIESDIPNPISVYGSSKLTAEEYIKKTIENYLICRVSWTYGQHGNNFFTAILNRRKQTKKIQIVDDQFGAPTWTMDILKQISICLSHNLKGTCHISAKGKISRCESAVYFFALLHKDVDIIPCKSDTMYLGNLRPKNSVLENKVLNNLEINIMPDWKISLEKFVGLYSHKLLSR